MKRHCVALEQRRIQAARFLSKGLGEAEVGVHRQSVTGWHRQLQTEGRDSLNRAQSTGRKHQLARAELLRHGYLRKRGPDALGLATNL